MRIDKLLSEIKKSNPRINIKLVEKAYDFARKAHGKQKRFSGESFLNHPLRVTRTLAKMNLDEETILAGMLHDVVEDTPATIENVKKEFGGEVAGLISGVTKIGKIKYTGEERYAENLKKMIIALSEDIRVAFIKLADRLDNLRTLDAMRPDKQILKAKETMDIYAPIAHRMGIGWLKGELEDLAFPYLYPKEYDWLRAQIKNRFQERNRYLKNIAPKIKRILKKAEIDVIKLDSRAKRYWSLYQKLKTHDMDINRIYDLVALRIVVPTVSDCYSALGTIHKRWPPMVGRIKDYIAVPKPNGYRSIHTTVTFEDGQKAEFQIRTLEMHQQAEYGISAHWYYSEQKGIVKIFKKFAMKAPEKNLAIVKQLRSWAKEITSSSHEEILSDSKKDFFKDRIYVFTPKGDVIELPEKSCAIDFAYAIHTDVGNRCNLAKINGRAASLYTQLKNGDIVDIKTDKNRQPSKDWLKFVQTHHAKIAIKKIFQERKEKKPNLLSVLAPVYHKLVGGKEIQRKVLVSGHDDMKVYFPKCCDVRPKEEIVGYITKMNGIAVHSPKCANLIRAKKRQPQNIVAVTWSN